MKATGSNRDYRFTKVPFKTNALSVTVALLSPLVKDCGSIVPVEGLARSINSIAGCGARLRPPAAGLRSPVFGV